MDQTGGIEMDYAIEMQLTAALHAKEARYWLEMALSLGPQDGPRTGAEYFAIQQQERAARFAHAARFHTEAKAFFLAP
jgi:hypothetical protein